MTLFPPDPADATDLRLGRVLLAEDDSDFRRLLRAELVAGGLSVRTVADGRLLLSELSDLLLCDSIGFDVLVSDVYMPGWTGLAALNALRCAGSDVPVVLLSAFPDQELSFMARELGAELLMKPFEIDELLRTIIARLPRTPAIDSVHRDDDPVRQWFHLRH